MSRRSRRAAVVASGVPEVIGRPFEDESDYGEPSAVPAGYEERRRVPSSWDSLNSLLERRPAVIPVRSPSWGYGGRKAPIAAVDRRVTRSAAVSRYPFHKGKSAYEHRRDSFNVVVPAFSKRVDFCVKRKVKREMVFAMRKSGRNGAKVYRRTYASSYRC